MHKFIQMIVLAAALGSGVDCFASDHGTPEEAVAMVHKAIAYLKANGLEKTIAEVNSPKGQFVDRDMYISIGYIGGLTIAHGGNPKMIGKDLNGLKDVDGYAFIKARNDLLKTQSSSWVHYKFPNPVTKKIENKSMYSEKFGDLVINCGIYKD